MFVTMKPSAVDFGLYSVTENVLRSFSRGCCFFQVLIFNSFPVQDFVQHLGTHTNQYTAEIPKYKKRSKFYQYTPIEFQEQCICR